MLLTAGRTHLYPGARGRVAEGHGEIEFSDGVRARARLEGDVLSVAAHVTAAGTAIPAKRWRISVEGGDFRVIARLN